MSKARGLADLGNVYSDGALSNRNMVINGAMNVAQRGTAAVAIASNGYFSCDRFLHNISLSFISKSTSGQNLNSVTPPPDFTNYIGVVIDTATTPTGDAYYNLRQNIEGHNTSQLNWGSSNARDVTISFWVRSSITGSFSVSLRNGGATRSYVTTYAISSADTWEKKTITVSGDTTGTWATDNSTGLTLNWGLGNSTGTYSTSTLDAWQAGSKTGATTGVDLVATLGATFYLTGVQLEVGDTATPFEHRSYAQEMALCQRFYERVGNWSYTSRYYAYPVYRTRANSIGFPTSYRVQKRASPTVTLYSDSLNATGVLTNISNGAVATVQYGPTGDNNGAYRVQFASDVSSNTAYGLKLEADAEL
jgi:hypothetical protein